MQDNFDFFKYAGIHRSVVLYTTPMSYIDDITVTPTVTGTTGSVAYSIDVAGSGSVSVSLLDKQGNSVASGSTASGALSVPNANLWWPYTMVANTPMEPGYLYTLQVPTTTNTILQLFGNAVITSKYLIIVQGETH